MTSRRIGPLFNYKKEYRQKMERAVSPSPKLARKRGRATGLLLRSNRREKTNISFTFGTCTCYPIGQTLTHTAYPHCIGMCVRVVQTRAGFRKDPWVVVAWHRRLLQRMDPTQGIRPTKDSATDRPPPPPPPQPPPLFPPFIRPRLNVDFSHR